MGPNWSVIIIRPPSITDMAAADGKGYAMPNNSIRGKGERQKKRKEEGKNK